jgi:hypothetical protein
MDADGSKRQDALRARADEAMREAAAAADAASAAAAVVADSIAAATLVCWDRALDPRDRLALIDAVQGLLPALKELAEGPPPGRSALVVEVLRRTNELLRRYARLVRGSPRYRAGTSGFPDEPPPTHSRHLGR